MRSFTRRLASPSTFLRQLEAAATREVAALGKMLKCRRCPHQYCPGYLLTEKGLAGVRRIGATPYGVASAFAGLLCAALNPRGSLNGESLGLLLDRLFLCRLRFLPGQTRLGEHVLPFQTQDARQ